MICSRAAGAQHDFRFEEGISASTFILGSLGHFFILLFSYVTLVVLYEKRHSRSHRSRHVGI